ncbi:MAG: selenide, water dikinase SelD [Proteobacteria bacterium]|nr:selenide, water dikinase SelD [Pseudomonadota bacterium]
MLPVDIASIRLTETVTKGGCAAKLPAGSLRALLESLKRPMPAALAVGSDTMDDACLWDLGNGQYLIQTLDFFTPIVDDAKDFGAIAAANALSDVYAMGGLPKIALTILGFPAAKLPLELLKPLMEGAIEKIVEAGACLAGGHTIDDDALKLGFSVSGFVDKDKAWTNANAKTGDILILTKGLGTGTITSAIKSKKAKDEWIAGAVASMKQLNFILDLVGEAEVHAATDVTGFGLAGHGAQMAQASGKCFEISTAKLPSLPGALDLLEQKILNRAHHSNAEYVATKVAYLDVEEAARWLTVDPQTSGGLLLAVEPKFAEGLLSKLRGRFPNACQIGTVRDVQAEDLGVSLKFRG